MTLLKKRKLPPCVLLSIVVSACGGGSSSTPTGDALTNPNAGVPTPQLAYNACESSYYQGVIGTYNGTFAVENTVDGDLKVSCDFTVELTIDGTPSGALEEDGTLKSDGCDIQGSYQGTVVQNIFLPITDDSVHQCITPQGTLSLSDPFTSAINPEIFFENITYPVPIAAFGPVSIPFMGPYQGDQDVIVDYVNLFGGSAPLVDFINITGVNELEFVIDTTNPNVQFTSNLVKE